MNANLSKIVALGLIQSENFSNALAQAIEANPNLANFLANPEPPVVTKEDVMRRFRDDRRTYIEHSLHISEDFEWRVQYKYTKKAYYKTVEDANNESYSYRDEAEENYPIEGIRTCTDSYRL